MSTSRSDILQLLADGKISAAEAADLLSQTQKAAETAVAEPEKAAAAEAVIEKEPAPKAVEIEIEEDAPKSGKQPTWFKVRVRNAETGKNKVSVNIPIRMLNLGLRIGRRFTNELDELNWDELNTMMTDMHPGMLVEVQDEDSNEHVQVYLE